jgi:sporulation protein YqfC
VRKKKISREEEKASLREKIADALDMSKEVIIGAAKITMIGEKEMSVENYRGIMEYTETLIKVGAKPHNIRISGKNLEIKAITQEMVYITGFIKSVDFLK